MNIKAELASCVEAPPPHQRQRGRHATDSQSCKARVSSNLSPRDWLPPPTLSRLLVANHVFLGSWTVDICQEGCSQRSAPQRTHMTYLRWHFCCAPRKLSSWNGGGDKMRRPTWGVCAHYAPGHLSCLDLERAQKAMPIQVCDLLEHPRT